MKVQNVGMTNYQRQQNFGALPKGRPPHVAELIREVKSVMESGNKEAARQLMADYRTVQPSASHELNVLNIAYLDAGGSPALTKARELFEIQPLIATQALELRTL